MESEVLEGSNKKNLGDEKMENSGKKVEVESDLSGERRNPTFLDTKVEEHIWLLPKVVRRAQKQKEQRAVWNASGSQLIKSKILSFLNQGGTSGRKQNL